MNRATQTLLILLLIGCSSVKAQNVYATSDANRDAVINSLGLSTGLAAYYPLDGNANDQSGNVNHGTLDNSPGLSTGKDGTLNSAYSFSAANGQRVLISNSDSLSVVNFQSGYTIAAWVYPTDFSGEYYKVIVSKGKNAMTLRINANGKYLEACHQEANGSTGCQTSSDTTVTLNKWAHVAITWDGATGTWQMYKNGVAAKYTGNMRGLRAIAAGTVTIASDDWYKRWYFNGVIDDVRIYNRSLSAAEVIQLYQTTP